MTPEEVSKRWTFPLALLGVISTERNLPRQFPRTSPSAARVFAERIAECSSEDAGLDLLDEDPLGGYSAVSVGLHLQDMIDQGEFSLPDVSPVRPEPFAFFSRYILDFLDEVERVYPEGITIPPERLT